MAWNWFNKKRAGISGSTEQFIDDIKHSAADASLLLYFWARATDLLRDLEALWHQWDNAGEKLIHPLDGTIDKLKGDDWNLAHKKRDFMVLYSHHLMVLKVNFPDFSSDTVTDGYPSQKEYFQVRSDLIRHIEKLKTTADTTWKVY